MGLQIEYISVGEIITYKQNARVHSDNQVSQLVNSIREFGFTNPVLIDEHGELIAGHGRLAAAAILQMDSVPAIRLTGLSEKQIKALRIVDNQLALNASWDLDLLAAEIVELEGEDFDLDLLGFDDEFLRGLLPDDEAGVPGDPDEAPEPSDKAPDVGVVIGPYELSITRADWDKWETAMCAKVGFEKDDILTELKKRLKF